VSNLSTVKSLILQCHGRRRDNFACAILVGVCSFSAAAVGAAPPPGAAAVGYTVNTFSTNFTASNVDVANSGAPGYSWYPWGLFGSHTNLSAITINPDGSVTLAGDTTGPGGELMTATAANNPAKFVGTAFGGGAYIEAEFRFNPDDVARAQSKGWPAFWSLPLESSVLKGAAQWPGQAPGYMHAVEVDFFEYLYLPYNAPRNLYGAGMHDWYGIPNVTCPRGLCAQNMQPKEPQRKTPEGTNFTQYHHYGFLWVPATGAKPGYARFYFDGQSVGPDRQWAKYTGQPPPPTNQPWAFGVLDQHHLVLILGTGPNEPMTIRSVNVWQASADQNLHQ
jgi:hypothetical protein